VGVIILSRNKKTDEKSRGRHAMPEENNKKNNDKQVKQKQPNMRIKKQEPVKAKKKVKTVRKVKRVVVTILLLAIILAGTLFGYKIYQNGGGLTGALATILGEDTEKLQNLEPIQLLIMGESGVDDYKLADTIMVASYNPKTQKASLMSIPRDTYVGRRNRNAATQNYLASYKINTVFRSGTNIPEAIDRINALTGLNLENYVIIDTKALIKLVDAIGGVTFNVPIDMYYTEDTDQNLYIDLKAGEQLIDGAKAEQLLRFRHNNDFNLTVNNEKILYKQGRDRYSVLFLYGKTYTDNCYNCDFAKIERVSDITVGDSWGTLLGRDKQKEGISLILCQTKKGQRILEDAQLTLFDVDLKRAIQYNHQLEKPMKKSMVRVLFFWLNKKIPFAKAAMICFPIPCLNQLIRKNLKIFHIID